jgi:outer membrane lipoprotein-sorting protein
MGAVPQDSTASGTVVVEAGSDSEQGTVTILTRGASQTVERVATSHGTKRVVFSNGLANDTDHVGTKRLYTLELASSSQSALFPLPLISAILSYPDSSYQYVGLESLNGADCHHVRVARTFASQQDIAYLAPFSTRDLWINAKTGLPAQITYSMREGTGAIPSTSVTISYSNYQVTGGVQYPFEIVKSINGTPWMTITISSVLFNTGLSDSNFSLE